LRRACALYALVLLAGCGGSDDNSSSSAEPAREAIAFASSRDGDFEIYTMRPDGSDVRQLTRNEETDDNEMRDDRPLWSPDGSRIAFASTRDHGRGGVEVEDLYVMRADGAEQRRLTENDTADMLTGWTDAGEIVYWACTEGIAGCELRRVDPSGDGEKGIFETDEVVIGSSGPHQGEVYARILSRDAETLEGGRAIAIDVETGETRPAEEGIPSPDGRPRLIATDRDANGGCLFHDCAGHAAEIYVGDRRLTRTTADEGHIVWSPDGTRILFGRIHDENDDWELWVMNADGTCPKQLTDNGDWDWNPDWVGPRQGSGALAC
jgi:Tol biopolymer transport system component